MPPRKQGKVLSWVLTALLLAILPFPAAAADTPLVRTDKALYRPGETIRVAFAGAPGLDGDWLCLVPAEAPDTEGGDYRYLPPGAGQGSLVYTAPAPGTYEVRAYFDYRRRGYAVSARQALTVAGAALPVAAPRLERPLDPNDPFEATVPPGRALVYLYREPLFASYGFEVPVLANGQPVAVLTNGSYLPFVAEPGTSRFTASAILDKSRQDGPPLASLRTCEATLSLRGGQVYYLRLRMIPRPFWDLFLEEIPEGEGANAITGGRLVRLK